MNEREFRRAMGAKTTDDGAVCGCITIMGLVFVFLIMGLVVVLLIKLIGTL